MKILLLENNIHINTMITKRLLSKGYSVDSFFNATEAFAAVDNNYTCFILGINTPLFPKSLKMLRAIKDYYPKTPVIMLHVDGELDIKVLQSAYRSGCDDFLKKPFLMEELETKIAKLLNIRHDTVTLGAKCSFDFSTGLLCVGGVKKHFSKKERRLFGVLYSNKETIVSFETIKAIVWEGEPATLDSIRSLIRRLRQKFPFKCIETIVDSGYILKLGDFKHHNVITHERYDRRHFISA